MHRAISTKRLLVMYWLVVVFFVSFVFVGATTGLPYVQSSNMMAHTSQTDGDPSYVGPEKCAQCHSSTVSAWNTSRHSKMIQPLTTELLQQYGLDGDASDPKSAAYHGITVGSNFPYTIGGKWKVRFLNATADPNDYSKWTVAVWQYIIATETWSTYHADSPKDWGASCAQCHVTGFDSSTETFSGVELSDSVTCESCHGPGGSHAVDIDAAKANPMPIDLSAELCGQCHIRGTFPEYEIGNRTSFSYTHGEKPHKHHQQYYDWNMSEHRESGDFMPSDTCLRCKSTDNIFNTDLITKVDITITAKNFTNPVTCVSCHDPTTLKLRISTPNSTSYPQSWALGSEADWNSVCMQCHTGGGSPETKDKETWHHAQREVFTESVHYESNATCTDCHMALDTKSAVAYDIRNHTMLVKSYDTYQYSCGQAIGCHKEQGTAWAEERVEEIQASVNSTLVKTEVAITLAEEAITAANQTAGVNQTAITTAANYLLKAKSYKSFVEADGSLGFHNPTYALSLLHTALDYAGKAESTAAASKATVLTNSISTLQTQVTDLQSRVSGLETYMYIGTIGGVIVGIIIGLLVGRRWTKT